MTRSACNFYLFFLSLGQMSAIYWPFRPCSGCTVLLCDCLVYSVCTGAEFNK